MTNHQSKPNKITMHPLIIGTLLSSLLIVCSQVTCKPNSQQQLSRTAPENYDKQLIKKTLNDENQLPTGSGIGQNNSASVAAAASSSAAQMAAAAAQSSSNINFQCPEQFGYYTDTRDCTKYFVCVFGEVLHESCTGGLRFSRELQTCDWPRNVDCPHASAGNSSSSGAASNSSPYPTTTTATVANGAGTSSSQQSSTNLAATTITPGSSTSLAPNSYGKHHHLQAHHHPHQHHNSHNAKENSNQDNEDRSLKSSASLVFADEGSDPQQPSFDEAVSPVITPDGTIHLHDGSGGTFSLTPNHNRADHDQQQQQPQENRPNNVDVFVKPIQLASQQQVASSNGQQSRARASQQQQQQLLSASNQPPNQRQANSVSKLQPAMLPELRRGALVQPSGQSNSNQQQQQQQHHHHQSQLQAAQSHHGNVGHFSNNDNKNSANSHTDNQSSGETGSDSESVNNGDELPNDPNGAQADQESYEDVSGQMSGSLEEQSSPQQSAATGRSSQQQQQQQQQAGYIPPVMASAPPRTMSAGQQQQQQVVAGGRQSSQLLSFNNRQVQDSRQSFRPILLSSSNPQATSQHSSASSSTSQQMQQLTNGNYDHNLAANQRGGQQQTFSLASQPSRTPFSSANDEDDPQQEDQTNRPPVNSNNQQFPQKQQANGGGRQQSSSARQNNQTLRPQQQPQSHQVVGDFANDRQLQNNRQSRMSANFNQQLQPALFTTGATPTTLAAAGERQSHSRAPPAFLAAPDNQIMSNNVNFNDSSKLIRLQASHFEQQLPRSSSSSLSEQNNLQLGISNSFVPKFPSRSQNVLFSQQPFGFVSDQSSGNNALIGHEHLQAAERQVPGGGGVGSSLAAGSRQVGADGLRLLHQQRRPRPPKRQQIPSGVQRRPVANQQLRPQLIDSDGTTTSQPLTTTSASSTASSFGNSFLSPHDASFMEVADEQTEPPAPVSQLVGTRASSNQQVIGATRPLVAPTTVNFQQQDAISSNGFATLPTTFATTPSSGGRRFNDALAANGHPRTGTNLNGGLTSSTSSANANHLMMVNQGQRSAQLIAPSSEQSISPQGNAIQTSTVSAISSANSLTNQQQPDQQDPQLIANRYLNSAIDALEAGQPFGAVDYDFDILNDNSTDRRNPTGQLAAGLGQQAGNGSAAPFSHSNANANRPRQQQRLQPTFGSGNVADEEGENISLINGQPSGRASSGSRAQQANGRSRANSQQVNTGARQQQVVAGSNNQQFGQQQMADLFSANPNNPPSLASSPSPSAQANGQQLQQQQQQPTKKPRPTNRKISVNHEQALANNRASTEPARRPEALFSTPIPLQTATKCDNRHCRLPDCKCGDTLNPGGLDAKVIPQVVLLTFDDAVNDLNWEIYEELFTGRTNPNGCPILATFYVSHEWTDYGQVQTLYSRGHEMASHSVTHSFGEKFSKSQWFKEVNGQREILNMYGGVKMNDVRGMRAPFLQIGGNKMFEMLYDANFTYDSSMPIFENSPPLWPYTLDYQLTHECMITPCPTKSFPGVWEVGMTMWVDLRGGRCSMGDACSNPPDEDGVYEMLMKNFNRHYKSNRAPFGLFYHSAWFNTVHHRRGFLRFMGTVNSLSDVFFVTNWQMLQWMRKPTPISEINSFEPWQCPAKNDRPPPCFHPSVCNVKSEHGTRFMKTCQPCPVNQQYPWVGSTGFKGKQAAVAAAAAAASGPG